MCKNRIISLLSISRIFIVLLMCLSLNASAFAISKKALATTLQCTSVTDVGRLGNILFKNANFHGGRGRTFLDQDHQLGGARTLLVAGVNGKVFSCFGLYRCDRPYGCRYYQAMCGDRLANSTFAKKARSLGSNTAYVGAGKGRCFSIDTSASRYGSVRK